MSQLAHPLPAACKVQFPDTVPSIRWDALQAPTYAVPTSHYAGHLPNGSGVQAHSADADFAAYGLVMVAHGNAAGRILWVGSRYGKPIISGHCYCAVRAASIGLIVGA